LFPAGEQALNAQDFITRWTAREGGAEPANYQMFLSELCELIGVARPDPAGAERIHNDYLFERDVRAREREEVFSVKPLDTDLPSIGYGYRRGTINSEVTTGLDLTKVEPLDAGRGLASRGVQPMGSGFIVTRAKVEATGLGRRSGLEQYIRVVVDAILRASSVPMDAAAISRAFKKGGKKIEPRIAQVLARLALYGHVSELADGKFVARRAA
jgi:hypothetical protein